MIDYILALVISFAGIILGGILALIAPEELRAGEKWWKILEWVVLIIIIAFVIYFSSAKLLWAIALSAVLVALKIFKREYPAFAFVLFLSFFEGFLFLAASLIFIYGLPKGTLDAKQIVNMKNAKKQIPKAIIHVLRKNILYLIFGFVLLPLLIAYSGIIA
jgi:hypothetical protein